MRKICESDKESNFPGKLTNDFLFQNNAELVQWMSQFSNLNPVSNF